MAKREILLTFILLVVTGIIIFNTECTNPSTLPVPAATPTQETPKPVSSGEGSAAFPIYSDKSAKSNHYVPSGWMGDTKDITFDDGCTVNPHEGKTCIKIAYSAQGSQGKGWAGIYWVDPANNWGEKDGGFNLTGKIKLTFWARGDVGSEQVEFKVGGLGRNPDNNEPNNRFCDSLTVKSTGPLVLTNEWQQYTIELSQENLSKIMGGFAWVTNNTQNPNGATLYLDDIKFE